MAGPPNVRQKDCLKSSSASIEAFYHVKCQVVAEYYLNDYLVSFSWEWNGGVSHVEHDIILI